MKRAGRVHWLVIVGVAGVLMLVGLFAMSTGSPTATAADFMLALAKGDANKLTDLSYIGSSNRDQLHKDWDFAVNQAGKYYRFRYALKDEHLQSDSQASVRMEVERNYGSQGSYPEPFELPLRKENGKWKVVVQGISHEMYPALPR